MTRKKTIDSIVIYFLFCLGIFFGDINHFLLQVSYEGVHKHDERQTVV